MPEGTTRIYRFGPFVLDVGDRSLKRDRAPISLTPKTFDLLVALVESAGRLVEKDTLVRRVWPDVAVEEGNLTKGVFSLRQVLEGDGPTRYIETVPKRGYRFTADVTTAHQEVASPAPAPPAGATTPQENSIAGCLGRFRMAHPCGVSTLAVCQNGNPPLDPRRYSS